MKAQSITKSLDRLGLPLSDFCMEATAKGPVTALYKHPEREFLKDSAKEKHKNLFHTYLLVPLRERRLHHLPWELSLTQGRTAGKPQGRQAHKGYDLLRLRDDLHGAKEHPDPEGSSSLPPWDGCRPSRLGLPDSHSRAPSLWIPQIHPFLVWSTAPVATAAPTPWPQAYPGRARSYSEGVCKFTCDQKGWQKCSPVNEFYLTLLWVGRALGLVPP